MPAQRTPQQRASAALATIESLMNDPTATPAVRLKAAMALLKSSEGKAEDPEPDPPEAVETAEPAPDRVITIRRGHPKIGRNDLCPCGSNLKYKRCCLNKPQPLPQAA